MADLVHVTTEANARRIVRAGIAARSRHRGERGVYMMPVLPSYTHTHQWVRELRQWRRGVFVAVGVRLPDSEPVLVGHYGKEHRRMTAAEAVACVRALDDPRGWEVFVPRPVSAAEVRRVRPVRQGIGWRYRPDAHGRKPCACPVCLVPGTPDAARIRARFGDDERRRTKPEIMAELRAATDAESIVDALWALSGRSRGGAEELAYLADHEDPEVRETLAEVLEFYRGPLAKRLRARLLADQH